MPIATFRRWPDARRRDRPALSEGAAPRRRLQPRRLRRPGRAGRPRAAHGRLGGHAGRRHRGHSSAWCRCRRPRRSWRVEFDDLLDALAATPLVLAHRPVGRRGDGRLHPRATPASTPTLDALRRQRSSDGRPGGAALRRVLRRPRRGAGAAARGARARPARAAFRCRAAARSTPPRRRASGTCANRRSACRWR